MLKTLLALIVFGTVALAQDNRLIHSFPEAFQKIIDPAVTETRFEQFFREYDSVLSVDDEVAEPGTKPEPRLYPLYNFKSSKLYQSNIDKLLQSSNRNHRLLAVKLIGASDDMTREAALLTKIKSNDEPTIIVWAGMSLMQMKSRHTTELFDFLVKYEDFGDSIMIPFYMGLDPASLQQTAFERISRPEKNAKILAAQSLSVTGLNSETERILKQAVKDWEVDLKGYALASISKLRIGQLLPLVKPVIDDPKIREVSLLALANSPTDEDRQFVINLIESSDSVSVGLLEALFRSENVDNLRVWLKALYSKKIEGSYFIWENEQPLLLRDELLPDLQTALEKINDAKILAHLVELLRGRTDDRSTEILITLMKNPDREVKYFSASVASNSSSPKLKDPVVQKTIREILRK